MDRLKVPKWMVQKFLRVKRDGLKVSKWTVLNNLGGKSRNFKRVTADGLKVDGLEILSLATK